jgi:hypothetical protein
MTYLGELVNKIVYRKWFLGGLLEGSPHCPKHSIPENLCGTAALGCP